MTGASRGLRGVEGFGPAERLGTHGLKVDLTPAEYRAESVPHAISGMGDVRGLKILLPRADIGLMQGIKSKLDPGRVFNPGRFVGGI